MNTYFCPNTNIVSLTQNERIAMDLQHARILVRKINSLFKSMEMDGSPQPTPIERDLMLSYLRQLYQTFLDDAAEGKITVSAPLVEVPKTEPVVPTYEAPKT